jgi:raffinose/stachyose/melibiose transport system permease protein
MNQYLFGTGWKRWLPFLLLLPGFLAYIIIALGPSIATSVFSLTDASGIPGIPINWIGFENYDEFLFRGLASRDNLEALQRTLIFMVVVTTVQFTLGLIIALLLNQGLKGTKYFRVLFFMPVILGVAKA